MVGIRIRLSYLNLLLQFNPLPFLTFSFFFLTKMYFKIQDLFRMNILFSLNSLFSIILAKYLTEAINCYDCRSEDVPCNVGECIGSTCVKMETSNIDNDRKTVSKGCSNQFEDNQCKQSYLGPKIVLRCTCDSNFCNGDRNLAAAGLQSMADGSESKFSIIPNQIILIVIFSFLFVLNFIFHF